MEQPKIAYVITSGCYSDYHICAVTLDRNKAERLKKLYSCKYDGDSTDIEEWDIDDLNGDFTEEEAQTEPVKYYKILIEKMPNSSPKVRYIDEKYVMSENSLDTRSGKIVQGHSFDSCLLYKINVIADNKDIAIKIAIDTFWNYLADIMGLT